MAERGTSRRAQVPLRIPEPLRARIAAVAKDAGRSMNAEILDRLERSFEHEDWIGSPNLTQLMETITSAMKSTGETAGFFATGELVNEGKWMAVPFAFDQAMAAANTILEYHRPPGKIEAPTLNVVEVVGGDGDIAEANERLRQIHENLGETFAEFELWKKEHDDE